LAISKEEEEMAEEIIDAFVEYVDVHKIMADVYKS